MSYFYIVERMVISKFVGLYIYSAIIIIIIIIIITTIIIYLFSQ